MVIKDWLNTAGDRVGDAAVETARKITRVIIGHSRFGPVILEIDRTRRPVFLPGLRAENNRPVRYGDDSELVIVGRLDLRGE